MEIRQVGTDITRGLCFYPRPRSRNKTRKAKQIDVCKHLRTVRHHQPGVANANKGVADAEREGRALEAKAGVRRRIESAHDWLGSNAAAPVHHYTTSGCVWLCKSDFFINTQRLCVH